MIRSYNFRFAEGSVNVITGANGAGKTLLLHSLFSDIVRKGCDAVLVEQDPDLISKRLSVTENITLTSDPEANEKCISLLRDLGLEHLSRHKSSELSGGEKRIIAILRGFFQSRFGGVLLIDEPTNDLDYDTVNLLIRMMEENRKGLTFIVVSHDDRIIRLGKNVFHVENGDIRASVSEEEEDPEKKTEVPAASSFDRKIFYKSMPANFIVIPLIILAGLLFAWFSYEFLMPEVQSYAELPDDEVVIYVPNSIISADYTLTGAVPISAIELLNDNKEISDRVKRFNEISSMFESSQVVYGLYNLNSTADYTVYPLEYYDTSSGQFHNVSELYGEEDSLNELYAKAVSEDPEDLSGELLSLFEEDSRCQITSVLVKLKGIDFFQFVNRKEILDYVGGNYFIVAPQTVFFVEQVSSFTNRQTLFRNSVLMSALLLAADFAHTGLYLFSCRRSFILFRDVGLGRKTQGLWVSRRLQKYGVKIAAALSLTAFIIALCIWRTIKIVSGDFICLLFFIAFLLLMSVMTRASIKIYLRRVYSWRYR